jgi:hypothetical protein
MLEVSDMAKFSFWVRIIAASLGAVLLSMVLSGCSAVKLGYSQLPDIAAWWLDSFIDFNDTQATQAKAALKKLHAWHRKEELPAVADLLAQAQTMVPNNITPEQACTVWASAQKRIDALMLESSRLAAPVVSQLGAKQLKHLEKQWASRNEDWKKDWLQSDPQDRFKKRLDSGIDRFGSFYGDFNPEQIKLMQKQIEQAAWSPEWGYQQRLKRQQAMLSALQTMSSDMVKPAMPLPQVEKNLLNLMQLSVRPQDPADLNIQLQLEQQACQNIAQLHNTTTPAQRLKAQRRFKAYENDVRDLIKAGQS